MKRSHIFPNSIVLDLFFLFLSGFMTISSGNNRINLRIQHYTTEEGLSQNYVDCIFKDSRGFLWFGTGDGLNRFDGYSFITYRPEKRPNSISNGFINDIIEDKYGNLWIATRNGLNKFDFESEKFTTFLPDSIADYSVTNILFDRNDNLWLGTLTKGVQKITFDKNLSRIESVKSIPVDYFSKYGTSNEHIYCLLEDHDGNIYVGSLLGLDKINPTTSEVIKFTESDNPYFFETTVVHSIYEDSKNVLWIGTESGLMSIDFAKQLKKNYIVDRKNKPGTNKYALSHGLIKAINENIYGDILIGTLGGLHLLNIKSGEFFLFPDNNQNEYSLNNKFINDIYCDNKGNVWVGTDKGGVNKYNDNQKKFYFLSKGDDPSQHLNHNIINSIHEDEENLWIGTAGGGLNRYNKLQKTFAYYQHEPKNKASINLDFISALAIHPLKNQLFAGTWGCGINIGNYSPNTHSIHFTSELYYPIEPDGPPFIYISSLKFDKLGNLWIGRPDGLQVRSALDGKVYNVSAPTKFGEEIRNVGCLFLDNKDNVWIGTTTGLFKLSIEGKSDIASICNPDSVFKYVHNANDSLSLSSNFIVCMHEDKEGKLWFSTYGSGINRLESMSSDGQNAVFSNFNSNHGFSNDVVYGMLEDDHFNLWLSTERGLTKYNYKTGMVDNYFESDGIQSNQFYWSAFYKNKKGEMYFGGTKGLNYFHPDSIVKNPNKPRVVITDFKIFNKSVGIGKEYTLKKTISETDTIILHHNENIISFEFASLCFFAPEKNQFKYILENFETNWNFTNSDRRYVNYTNLNPGTYYFKVFGSNNDGEWSEKPAVITLIVKPPWWKTIWFRLIGSILLITLLLMIYYIRVKNLELKKHELERIVAERTRELDESNKSLKLINQTKDKLFTIIAHDLRNPFNVILGMFDLLVKNFDRYEEKRKKEMLSMLGDSSANLYRLLENLLQWSRAQTGNIEYVPETILINDLVKSNLHFIKNQAIEKQIALHCNCDHKLIIWADKNLLNTILRNLLNNAIKFTEEGSITVTIEKDDIKNMALIHISDTGTGMELEKASRIFEVGKQMSVAGTRGEKGSGLGLILCYEFVHKNGGEIWVNSAAGKGSTFSFSLPLSIKKFDKAP